MFQSARYLTRGVCDAIPPLLQTFLWNCIDLLPEERDYFQVFRLEPMGEIMQQITHESEQPEYKKVYLIPSEHPIREKLYVIDSDEYSTMLLASEY
ncbi:MAG: hypothetical protein IKG82_03940 [Oscillospiraceae bacterium]|nr:hypothetical protein [Oscillospiraceae bacterium]